MRGALSLVLWSWDKAQQSSQRSIMLSVLQGHCKDSSAGLVCGAAIQHWRCALCAALPSPLKRHCGALGSHAALCCAALVLLSDAAHIDSGSSAALVELAQLLVVGSLLRSLCERHGLQHRPPWCLCSPKVHFQVQLQCSCCAGANAAYSECICQVLQAGLSF